MSKLQEVTRHIKAIRVFTVRLKEKPDDVDLALDLLSVVQCLRKISKEKTNENDMRINCSLCGSCPHCAYKK